MVTLKDVISNQKVEVYIKESDEHLKNIGYTEHGFRHANITASVAGEILQKLGYSPRECELASIAGYLHDIGNFLGRPGHAIGSALIVKDLLEEMGMSLQEIVPIMSAISNHEEENGIPTNPISSALILADKADVHRDRVRNPSFISFDIHDRVNYAAESSAINIDLDRRIISLDLIIDTKISQVMEYFEIFLSRMILCRKAADYLQTTFALTINNVRLL